MADLTRTIEVKVISTGDAEARRLITAINGATRASASWAREQRLLRQATEGVDNANRAASQSAKTYGQALNQAQRGTGRFNAGMQSLGYQLQDFSVQMAGGTSATRAFSMQFPQAISAVQTMAGGTSTLARFLMGPWGIALTTAAAVMVPLIARLNEVKEEAENTRESLEDLFAAFEASLPQQSPLSKAMSRVTADAAEASAEVAKLRGQLAGMPSTDILRARVSSPVSDASASRAAAQLAERTRIEGRIAELQEQTLTNDVRIRNAIASQNTALAQQKRLREESSRSGGSSQGAGQAKQLKTQREVLSLSEQIIKKVREEIAESRALAEARQQFEDLWNAGKISATEYLLVLEKIKASQGYATKDFAVLRDSGPLGDSRPEKAQEKVNRDVEEFTRLMDAARRVNAEFKDQLEDTALDGLDTLTDALSAAISGTRSWGDAFEETGRQIVASLVKIAAQWALLQLVGGIFGKGSNIFSDVSDKIFGSAKGNVLAGGDIVPFARGGVITSPIAFPIRSGVGLAGEAGPEAIMPLRRGRDGRLGVSGPNITINNNVRGAEVSVNETISGLEIEISAVNRARKHIADDINRGGSEITKALEDRYGLRRGGR